MPSPVDKCSQYAKQFADRLSRIDNADLRSDMRDTYEWCCAQYQGYDDQTYNLYAERRALTHMLPILAKYGY